MMRTLLACLLGLVTVLPATAACQGQDQIARLPPPVRAELTAAVDGVPYPRGNFWRASRGDQRVHIIGTYHLDDPRLDAVMTRLAPQIDAATTVLVEAGPAEETALQAALVRDPSLMFVMDGPTLPEALPAASWDRLKNALRARSIPPFLGAKMQPAYLSMLLGIPPCAADALAEQSSGLDQRVIDRATSSGVPVMALEPYDTVFAIFAGMTDAEGREMLELSLALDDQAEDNFATMVTSYFAQDSRMMWEYSRWLTLQSGQMDPARVAADFDKMEYTLMIARNQSWIPVIEAAAARGPTVAAFGALHLAGDDGVLALLERQGFTIQRLPL